jgi:phosphoglycerol transferase MdoB-like AlkP superfamily enzyme
MEMVDPGMLWMTFGGLVFLVAFCWGLTKLFKVWLHRKASVPRPPRWGLTVVVLRVAGVGLSILLLSSLTHFNHPGNPWRKTFQAAGAHWKKASQPHNYRVNGFVGGFLYNLDIPAMKKPAGYSRATMEKIVAKYTAEAEKKYGDRDPHAMDNVNVVTILSESFSDLTRLKGMKLAEDPLPRTRQIMAQGPHGHMLTQKIGGGTSTMEFETMTGLSMSQFNSALDTPFQQLVPHYRSFPSAVEMFNQMGHKTVAIHPYSPTMYQRDKVYPILGFSKFISQNQMAHRGTIERNRYISDASAFSQVLDTIQGNDKPVYVNLVTMQNHTPYVGRYSDPIKVDGLNPRMAALVGGYARGIKYSDQAIADFISALDHSDEKTIVVLYGDHLPAGTPKALYRKNSVRTLHETPFFIHANFGKPSPEELPTTSPIFFLPRMFDLAGARLSPYYTMLRELENHVSAMEQGDMIAADDSKVSPKSLSPEDEALLHDYRLVEYDLSVGKRYSEKMLYPTPAGTVAASGSGE